MNPIKPIKMSESNNNKIKTVLLAMLVIAALIIVLMVWKWMGVKSDLAELEEIKEAERIEMQLQVDSLMSEHNRIKEAYGQLADSLKAKDSIIQANAVEIKKLLDTKWEYGKTKKKLDRLREITQGYLHQMDSLYTLNRQLMAENEQMREEIQVEQRKSRQLSQEKEKLSEKIVAGSAITAYNVQATGIRIRGGKREEPTDKGRRIDKIKVSFSLSENVLAQAGKKTVYIRIADPNGKVLMKGRGDDYSFLYKGERLQYSIMENVSYANQSVTVETYWNKLPLQEDFTEGTYNVTLYLDDAIVGQTSFKVR